MSLILLPDFRFAMRDPVKWMQVVSEQRIETIILSKSGSDALRVRRTPQERGPPSPTYKLLDLSSCSEVVCLGGPTNLSDVKEAFAKSALGGLSASKFKVGILTHASSSTSNISTRLFTVRLNVVSLSCKV